jgi:hypothetical protein
MSTTVFCFCVKFKVSDKWNLKPDVHDGVLFSCEIQIHGQFQWEAENDVHGGPLLLCEIQIYSQMEPGARSLMSMAVFCFYVKVNFTGKLNLKPKR